MLKKISSKQLILVGKKYFIYYHHGKIYSKTDHGNEQFVAKMPGGLVSKICSNFLLFDRILRLRPRCAQWVDDDSFIIAQKGKIYRINLLDKSVVLEHSFIDSMTAPLYLCKISNLKGFSDGIVYGTYKNTYDEASIWFRGSSGVWNKVYVFEKKRILHIHNIIQDSENDRLLILTGDSDTESGIWEIKDNFSVVNLLLGGSQQYRSCVAFAKNNHIIFATDTPLEKNYIYDYDESTKEIKKLYSMPGPAIYGTCVNDKYVFSTSVEPDSRLSGVKYLLSYKLAPGIKDRESHIIVGNDFEGFRDIVQFKKDSLPMGLCQFGNIFFPSGKLNTYYLCPQSVKKYSGTLEVSD